MVQLKEIKEGPKYIKSDPWKECLWLVELLHENIGDAKSREGNTFRRRYGMPYSVFLELVELCIKTNEEAFKIHPKILPVGQYSIPLELKILGVLYLLTTLAHFLTTADTCQKLLIKYS